MGKHNRSPFKPEKGAPPQIADIRITSSLVPLAAKFDNLSFTVPHLSSNEFIDWELGPTCGMRLKLVTRRRGRKNGKILRIRYVEPNQDA